MNNLTSANLTSERGIVRSHRAALLPEKRTEYIEIRLACAKLGMIAACQYWRKLGAELVRCIKIK